MTRAISGATVVAGVAGAPVRHSLSPLIHNAWLAAAGVDGVYVAFSPPAGRFTAFAEGLRGGAVRGLNITVPFKQEALALADAASMRATGAGAANVLIFEPEGTIRADNTDGAGLLAAFAEQAPGFDPKAGPVVILGAGGAARGAAATLREAGTPEVRIVNRTAARAAALAKALNLVATPDTPRTYADAVAVINATSAGLSGEGPEGAFDAAPDSAVFMDMVYTPLKTPFLAAAEARGQRTVDGLAMLIGQAKDAFTAFYGAAPPEIDVRALVLRELAARA
jgi:shikimate dehydrogenase